MSDFLIKTATFVRDLLGYDEQLIRIGRLNYELDDFDTAYIGIDSLGGSSRIGKEQSFDGDEEELNLSHAYTASVTITFYADGARNRAEQFALLVETEDSLDLQRELGITVMNPSSIVDVKLLTGQQYGERQELTVNVIYNTEVAVDTQYIHTAQTTLISD